MFMFSFSISFVCIVVILLVLCAIPLWDSAEAYSPSGKELHPSSQEDVRFSSVTPRRKFSLHPASSLFGTQHQLTHPPRKNSTIPLRKMPVFQGVAPRHTIFTSSCVIPLWDSAITHSPFGKELNPCSQEDTRFSGRRTLAYKFYLALRHPSLGLSNSSLTLRKKLKFSSLEESYFSRLFVLLMFSHYPALGSL